MKLFELFRQDSSGGGKPAKKDRSPSLNESLIPYLAALITTFFLNLKDQRYKYINSSLEKELPSSIYALVPFFSQTVERITITSTALESTDQ